MALIVRWIAAADNRQTEGSKEEARRMKDKRYLIYTLTQSSPGFFSFTVAAVSNRALHQRGKDTSATIEYNCRLLKNPQSFPQHLALGID
jgi:hypothetical protein